MYINKYITAVFSCVHSFTPWGGGQIEKWQESNVVDNKMTLSRSVVRISKFTYTCTLQLFSYVYRHLHHDNELKKKNDEKAMS